MIDLQKSQVVYLRVVLGENAGGSSLKCVSRHVGGRKKNKSITNTVAKLVQTAGGNRDGSDILQSEKEKDCLRVVFNA